MTTLSAPNRARAFVRGFQAALNNWLDKGFEPEVSALPVLIPRGGVCFHVGASDGRHTYAMVRRAGASKVYAFEPSGYSYAMLESAIWFQGLNSTVEKHHKAVGAGDGVVTLTTPRKINGNMGRAYAFVGDDGSSRADVVSTGDKTQEIVGVTSIDNFVAANQIQHVDFIRADCEGAEMLVLEGAARTIERDSPSMLIEIHPIQLETMFHSSGQAVLDRLHGLGYRTFAQEDGRWQECNVPFKNKKWKDYACLHAERHCDRVVKLLS